MTLYLQLKKKIDRKASKQKKSEENKMDKSSQFKPSFSKNMKQKGRTKIPK